MDVAKLRRGKARRVLPALLAAAGLWCTTGALPAHAQRPAHVWFSPATYLTSGKGATRDQDYLSLFDDNAPWSDALSHVEVFAFDRTYLVKAPDDELSLIFGFLRRHHIRLGVEWPVVDGTVSNCGQTVEGINHNANASRAAAQRVARLGGRIDFVMFDEPLHFGHYYSGPDACRYEIADLPAQAAGQVAQVTESFPDVAVIETEPVSGLGTQDELVTWLSGLKAALGSTRLAAVHLDVQWNRDWAAPAAAIVTTIRGQKLRYGLIVDGVPQDASNEAWVSDAQANVLQWAAAIGPAPAQLRFQSWHPYPDHLLPEDDSGTIPFLIDWYCDGQPGLPACRR